MRRFSRLYSICRPTSFSRSFATQRKASFQYISDLHVDVKGAKLPKIVPSGKYLGICGDIGNPQSPNFRAFLAGMSNQFEKVFFIPGNHEFDCGSIYQKDKADIYEPMIKDICRGFSNVHYMNRHSYQLTSKTVLLGSIMWSLPIAENIEYTGDSETYMSHVVEHKSHVKWIEEEIKRNKDKKVIVMTHFLPTFQLIENKYKKKGIKMVSRYATNLEHMIKSPVIAWLGGHSHSVMECHINGVYCGLNAYGYPSEKTEINRQNKIIEFE